MTSQADTHRAGSPMAARWGDARVDQRSPCPRGVILRRRPDGPARIPQHPKRRKIRIEQVRCQSEFADGRCVQFHHGRQRRLDLPGVRQGLPDRLEGMVVLPIALATTAAP